VDILSLFRVHSFAAVPADESLVFACGRFQQDVIHDADNKGFI
jgi:hypothetical protein